jgi:hypothetical protein
MRLRIKVWLATAGAALGCLVMTGSASAQEPMTYFGGEVMNEPHVYLTFWGKSWNEYSNARNEIKEMFNGISNSSWQRILAQYYDTTGGHISGTVTSTSWTDERVSAPQKYTEAGIENEILYAQSQQGWPGAGINNLYYVAVPPGATQEDSGFVVGGNCGGHRYTGAINAPWGWVDARYEFEINCRASDPGGLERLGPSMSYTASHEYAEAVTDPEGERYHGYPTGWMTKNAAGEIADKCDTFGKDGGTLANGTYVASLWSNFDNSCKLSEKIPPVGTTTEATNVGTFQATGNGIVEAKGLSTTCYFQWGTTTSYGKATGAQSCGSSWNATAVNAGIGFLTPGTTYHYRLVATNGDGTSYGPDKTFTSSPNGAFFSDASNGNNMSRWEWNTSKGWQQEFLYGHTIAAGTSPATLMINGQPNVFYVDASNGNTITDWTWNSTTGWQQQPFWGHTVAKGTSPVATTVNGEPSVFYVDASNGNTISEWKWNSTTGWQQLPFWGHQVAAGSSPSAVYVNGVAHVFYVDATYGNTITDWTWTPTAGWQQTFFYGDTVAAGTSPAALNIENTARAFYVDASRGNTVTEWSSPGGWHQLFLGGHSVVSGSSPSGIVSAGTPYVFFGDANNSKSLSAWTWNATEGWHQYFLYGHALTEGTSPAATLVNGVPNVFFNDASDANTITDWIWNSTTGWQQSFFWGHPLSAGSSPGVF